MTREQIVVRKDRPGGVVVEDRSDLDPYPLARLRSSDDQITLAVRPADDDVAPELVVKAARKAIAHAVEWMPDLPLRARTPHHDLARRFVLESAGMNEDRVVVDDEDSRWRVFEAPVPGTTTTLDADSREAVLDLWMAVNDAGGAVGFLPGASRYEVSSVLAEHERSMAAGATTAIGVRSRQGDLVSLCFVAQRPTLQAHVVDILRVMTHPEARGLGHGALLMAAAHRVARDRGAELALLDYREASGVGAFYERLGYVEVGRVPGQIRVAEGDDRDSVLMARRLDGRPLHR